MLAISSSSVLALIATISAVMLTCNSSEAVPSYEHVQPGQQSYFINQHAPMDDVQGGLYPPHPEAVGAMHGGQKPAGHRERFNGRQLMANVQRDLTNTKNRIMANPRVQGYYAKVAPKIQKATAKTIEGVERGATKVLDKVAEFQRNQAMKAHQRPHADATHGPYNQVPVGPPRPMRPPHAPAPTPYDNARPMTGDEYDHRF